MKIARCNWSDSTPADLRGACEGMEEITQEKVESGKEQLLHFTAQGVDVWCVVRIESVQGSGLEMVVCYTGGYGMKAVAFALKDLALRNGFNSVRYHTTKPSIHRLYRRWGLQGVEAERVYRLILGGERG